MKFNSFLELLYLDKRYFTPNDKILRDLNISDTEKYCVIRFVSWDANHDVGYKGLTIEDKCNIVKKVSEHCKVFISSEGELPIELEQYRLQTASSNFHDVMGFASLCISEGSTTASEAVVLGVPTIYVNPLKVSYCDEEEKFGVLIQLLNYEDVVNKSVEILTKDDYYVSHQKGYNDLFNKMIDGTKFLTWFIEDYPQSRKIMKENPDYQYKIK